jgi:cell division septation protein DedD
MPRKPKAVPLSKIEDIQSSLKQKAATPKTISLDELVKTLAQPIQDMLNAGYSYEDVAEVFQGHGVELAASGIKSFHKKALTTSANKSGDNSRESSEESTSQEIANGNGSSTSLPYISEQSDDSKNKTTKRKKTTAKESEEKPSPPSYPNRLAFVPKIYSDDEL